MASRSGRCTDCSRKKEEIPIDCPPELKTIIESCWEIKAGKTANRCANGRRLKPLAKQKAPPPNDLESEIKKLRAEMEQMKLAYECQLVEEKQRLEAEKQKEIARLQLAQEQQSVRLAVAAAKERQLAAKNKQKLSE